MYYIFWPLLNLLLIFTAREKRKVLTLKDLDMVKAATPPLYKGSSSMFRKLQDKGEYRITSEIFFHF
jgi:hypothetical protein